MDKALNIDELKLETKPIQGFPAGTRVHTDKGLVPIQEIKAGDMVLSRPEWEGKNAPTEYKRVKRAFCSGENLIYRLMYVDNDEGDTYEYASGKKLKVKVLFVSGHHPIWVEGERDWLPACNLDFVNGEQLSSFNSNKAYTLLSSYPVLKVDNYHIDSNKNELLDVGSVGFCYENKNSAIDMITVNTDDGLKVYTIPDWNNEYDFEYPYAGIPQEEIDYLDNLDIHTNGILSTNVYTLEVEGFHTYFVGEDGIWVHNCGGEEITIYDLASNI